MALRRAILLKVKCSGLHSLRTEYGFSTLPCHGCNTKLNGDRFIVRVQKALNAEVMDLMLCRDCYEYINGLDVVREKLDSMTDLETELGYPSIQEVSE